MPVVLTLLMIAFFVTKELPPENLISAWISQGRRMQARCVLRGGISVNSLKEELFAGLRFEFESALLFQDCLKWIFESDSEISKLNK